MKKIFVIFVCITAVVTLMYCNNEKEKTVTAAAKTKDDQIKRGAYLVRIMGCHDCHTPKVFGPTGPSWDTTRLLSGHPASMPLAKIDKNVLKDWSLMGPLLTSFAGQWGVSFAANISSDTATGIGSWTFEQFKTTLKKGRYKGAMEGRMLLPPMPYQNFENINDEDLSDIFTYLKSTKPISNLVPAPIPPQQIP